ncbi:MAG TPA: tRNA pseudouridine(38-40) synthase TruA [Candidatus Cloacimonadota bacterium]|nr:tRNA pseudouridine(38-40) synthase TruA [Candidatus Cloacimonadota bacterium]
METRRVVLKIAYDGSGFCGWQIQEHCRSVQETIERALTRIVKSPVSLVCAGRTDTGVHATSQYAHFDYHGRMLEQDFIRALNRHLNHDIRILNAQFVSIDFHARYKAFERGYLYILAKEVVPFHRYYRGFIINQHLDLRNLQALAEPLLGRHDFSSFAQQNPEVPNRFCEVKEISISETEDCYQFRIRADRFLHNMVRRIVGTLCNLCTKKMSPEDMRRILMEADPRQTFVVPAPAAGLYLTDVLYPEQYGIE